MDDNKIIGDRVEEKDYKRNPEEDWEKKYNEQFKLYHGVLPEDYGKKDVMTMLRYVRGGEKQVMKEHKHSKHHGRGRVSRPKMITVTVYQSKYTIYSVTMIIFDFNELLENEEP